MRKILNILSIQKIYIVIILLNGALFAHENHSKIDSTYTLKQRVHELCGGHGLMHLDPEEIQKISGSFSSHTADIDSLQQTAGSDTYLSQLTGLIIRSDLSKDKKNEFLRRSYDIALAKSTEGKEWGKSIAILIEETEILSREEISRYTLSEDPYLKAISQRYLNNKQQRQISENGVAPTNSDTSSPKQINSSAKEKIWLPWILLGVLLLIIFSLHKVFRNRPTS
jgi:hypothetical protein